MHFVIPWTRLIDEQGLTGLYEGIARQADWALGLLAEGGEGIPGIHNADRPVDVTYNYTPFYSYLLSLFGILSFGEAVRAKIISVVFDAIMACGIYRIVRRNAETRFEPRLAFSLTLLLPTVFMNSSWWGQMDAIFTAFLVWAVYFPIGAKESMGMPFRRDCAGGKVSAPFLRARSPSAAGAPEAEAA